MALDEKVTMKCSDALNDVMMLVIVSKEFAAFKAAITESNVLSPPEEQVDRVELTFGTTHNTASSRMKFFGQE